jgi:hypothetical protein
MNETQLAELEQAILRTAHINASSVLAREYFKELGLNYSKIKESDLYKLREFILDSMYPLLADKTYSMIKELTMDRRIKSKFKKDLLIESELYANGSYFTRREAITFNEDGFIGFCGWASGCNRIPFINGFIAWCNYLAGQIKLKYTHAIPSQ